MNPDEHFQRDSSSRTCVFMPLWLEDLRLSQAMGRGGLENSGIFPSVPLEGMMSVRGVAAPGSGW